MRGALETRQHRGYTVELHTDHDCESPRENDNLGTVIAWHRRYTLSDSKAPKYLETPAEFNPAEYAVCLPIYLYEHGGIALSCAKVGQFAGRWDAGQLGWIYASRADILANWSAKRLTKKLIAQTTEILVSEIEEYSRFVSGECYGYRVVRDTPGRCAPDEQDSCWGFVGYEVAWQAAIEAADSLADARDAKANQLHDELRSEN